ncbi:hypothetical protein SAMN05421803_1672 [Nocardiopsis flavescens]|uniref:Uncharacterized protein n=1 Tax=Nocardiopsis flavescens TaxID=758803 RepID=A0A1M6X591_9ACTN|nr:hypothetical protein SAMN05421803_1672 [Nocardiopsis flavescens]
MKCMRQFKIAMGMTLQMVWTGMFRECVQNAILSRKQLITISMELVRM